MQLRHRLTVGRPQYCVTRAVLHCLVDDAETFSWMTRREKQWLIAYVQVAGPEPLEVAYDEAVELYEQADMQVQLAGVLHLDSQFPACPLPDPSGSSCVRNKLLVQTHLA